MRDLALGVGCRRGAPMRELIALAKASLASAGLSPASVALVCSIDLKIREAAVRGLARHLGVPLRLFPAARLEQETPRLKNPSDLVFRMTGCHGVAEGAALVAVGPRGTLVMPKRKSRHATCAVARGKGVLRPRRIGRADA